MKYAALIADIVGSRKNEDRKALQNSIKDTLTVINNSHSHLLSPYTITIGDEFQAIYKKPDNILKDIIRISLMMYPTHIRYSIGYGEITTEFNYESSIGMDGPTFYYARNKLDQLKNINETTIYFSCGDLNKLELQNQSLKILTGEFSKWKYNTFFIFGKMLNNMSISAISNSLQITVRGVYKIINTNRLRDYISLFEVAERSILNELNKL